MKHKTKKTLKTILLGALGIGAIVGVASGINTLVEKNDTELKTIHPIFAVGGLNETDGKYELSNDTLYTKDAFECNGLQVTLAFDNYIDYQVFFYESDGDFISATELISGNEAIVVPSLATHARIELTPNWDEMGDDYANAKNQVVKWYETTKYSSQIEIKVNKIGLLESIEQGQVRTTLLGQGNYSFSKGFTADTSKPGYFFTIGNVSKYNEVILKVKTSSIGKKVQFDESNQIFSVILYDLQSEQLINLSDTSTSGFNAIYQEGEFTYVSYDIKNINELVVQCTNADVDTLEVYMR